MSYRPSGASASEHSRSPYADEQFETAPFIARLTRMSPAERLYKSRYEFSRRQLMIWAGHYPDEVPRVNGEFEFIALRSADVRG